jgi:hypothetical protein
VNPIPQAKPEQEVEPISGSREPAESVRLQPKLEAVNDGHEDVRSQRYVLACAAITAASELLGTCHATTGNPFLSADPEDSELECAVAMARSAAGGIAAVGARFLTRVRQDHMGVVPELPSPVRPEPGITSPGLIAETQWRITMRALSSATAEAHAAAEALEACDAPEPLLRGVSKLVRVTELLTTFHLAD